MCAVLLLYFYLPRGVQNEEGGRGEDQYDGKVQLLPRGLTQAPGIHRSCSHEGLSPVLCCGGHQ